MSAKDVSIEQGLKEPDVPEKSPSNEPPDGGFQAWATILGASLVSLSTFGMINGFGVFLDFYKREYLRNYSATVISLVGSVQVFILYILASIAGAIFDAVGPRILIPFSGLIVVFSLFTLSLAKEEQLYQIFLTQAILFDIGAGFGFFPVLGLAAHWFKRKMAFALGIIAAGASLGGIIFPIMLDRLIPRIGFGWSVRLLAFIALFSYSIAVLTIKARRPPRKIPPISKLLDFTAFQDPCYLFLALGSWLTIFSIFNPFFYLSLYGSISYGTSNLTPYYLPILCAASILGRIAPGLVADRAGRFNVLVGSCYLSGVLILAVWYTSTSEATAVTFAALYGFSSGPYFSLLPACIATISPIEKVGGRVGMVFAFISGGALAGSPLGGLFIKDPTPDNFHRLILFSGIMSLGGASLLLVARFIRDRRIFVIV